MSHVTKNKPNGNVVKSQLRLGLVFKIKECEEQSASYPVKVGQTIAKENPLQKSDAKCRAEKLVKECFDGLERDHRADGKTITRLLKDLSCHDRRDVLSTFEKLCAKTFASRVASKGYPLPRHVLLSTF